MNTGLEGKTVLVVESVNNFGRPTAVAFAEEGANLVLASAQTSEASEETARQVSDQGVRVITGACATGNNAQLSELAQRGVAEFGHVDVLVNNTLLPVALQSLTDISFNDWKQKIETELQGSFFICQGILPLMVENNWGRVINYSGLAAFQGSDAGSSASEFGIIALPGESPGNMGNTTSPRTASVQAAFRLPAKRDLGHSLPATATRCPGGANRKRSPTWPCPSPPRTQATLPDNAWWPTAASTYSRGDGSTGSPRTVGHSFPFVLSLSKDSARH